MENLSLRGRSLTVWLAACVIVLLALADIVTTNYILGHGGHEINPLMAGLMKMTGPMWMVIKLAVTVGLTLWIVARYDRYGKIAFIIALSIQGAIVLCNTIQIIVWIILSRGK
jgi:hypothetical protein